MRLTAHAVEIIRCVAFCGAGNGARVWLYGFRLLDDMRGGDIDLLIQSSSPLTIMQKARIKIRLEEALQSPVDVLAAPVDEPQTPFAKIALSGARLLT